MGFLQGKRALIVGVVSNRSIAYGIAKAMHREGAELALTYQNDKIKERVDKLAAGLDCRLTMPCDVSSDTEIEGVFTELENHWDGLDIIIHSVAYAPREALQGSFTECLTREAFLTAHEISTYSFGALAKAGKEMMEGRNGALLTLSYLGAERVIPRYNVMGLAKASLEATVRYLAVDLGPEGTRVNSISAGPIKTLAAAGIGEFKRLLDYAATTNPLRRNVTIDDVGNTAAFLCSDLGSGITGENIYVDAGYHILGVPGES